MISSYGNVESGSANDNMLHMCVCIMLSENVCMNKLNVRSYAKSDGSNSSIFDDIIKQTIYPNYKQILFPDLLLYLPYNSHV